LDEQRREVAQLETMIQDAQHQYEATVRHHLQKMQKDSLDGDSKKFPALYANVRRWQDQLEPVLREFESRPDFHIHDYSKTILDRLVAGQQGNESARILFENLVQGVPRYEVCRRFLTTLFLTNSGNTDIHFEGEAERINGFSVSVLKAEKEWISFEGEGTAAEQDMQAAKGAKEAKLGRQKKVVKDAEQAEGEPLRKRRRASDAGKSQQVSTVSAGGC